LVFHGLKTFFFVIHWSLILFVTQIDFLPMTTVCGTGGDIRFCGQKQILILISSRHLFVHFVLLFSIKGTPRSPLLFICRPFGFFILCR
jgi:hypothetical protein